MTVVEATPNQFPFLVGILADGMSVSDGILISPEWVLTSVRLLDGNSFVEIYLGAHFSAKRTAASAALAARLLQGEVPLESIGIIACGVINFEVTRFLLAAFPNVKNLIIFDIDSDLAKHYQARCEQNFNLHSIRIASDVNTVLKSASLISIATTETTPHIFDISMCPPGSNILHISLRDFSPEVILNCDNFVDDIDQVCSAQTSIHLTEQRVGHRDFIRCTIGDILGGEALAKPEQDAITMFSPFSLGILDLAVAKPVYEEGLQKNLGTSIPNFGCLKHE